MGTFDKNIYNSKYYEENKERINKAKFLKRISDGAKPNEFLMKRYNISHDDVGKIQEESGLITQGNPDADLSIPKEKSGSGFTISDVRNCLDSSVARGEIRKNTATNYFNKLRFLTSLLKCEDDLSKCFKDYNKVIDKIKTYYTSINSRKDMLSAIISAGKHCTDFKIDTEKYREAMIPLIKESEQEQKENTNNTIIEWSKILERAAEIELEYGKYSDENILAKLYTEIPPVRDNYGKIGVILVDRPFLPSEYIGVRHGIQNAEGYIYINCNQAQIILFDYKTSGKFKDVIIELPPKLQKIIVHSFIERPRKYLFANRYGNPVGRLGNRIKFLLGSSINVIRHSRITHEIRILGRLSLTESEELSSKMLHSTFSQRSYVRNIALKNEAKKIITNEKKINR